MAQPYQRPDPGDSLNRNYPWSQPSRTGLPAVLSFNEPTYTIISSHLSGKESQERTDRLFEVRRQYGITPEPSSFVKITNMQGGLFVQFLPSSGAEGYEITVAADVDAGNVLRRETWVGTSNTEGFVPVGNLDQELFVQVKAYAGDKFSEGFSRTLCGSTIITGTPLVVDPASPEEPPGELPPPPPDLGGHDDGNGLYLP